MAAWTVEILILCLILTGQDVLLKYLPPPPASPGPSVDSSTPLINLQPSDAPSGSSASSSAQPSDAPSGSSASTSAQPSDAPSGSSASSSAQPSDAPSGSSASTSAQPSDAPSGSSASSSAQPRDAPSGSSASTSLVQPWSESQECDVEDTTARRWHVRVYTKTTYICEGILLSDLFVLTPDCIKKYDTRDLMITFGRWTQNGNYIDEVKRSVSQIIYHPEYIKRGFELVLLKLDKPYTCIDYIRPVCLASDSSQFYSSTCWTTDWDRLGSNGPPAEILQEVQVPVIGNNECSCDYLPIQGATITDQMMCAGRQEDKGACSGDSGGLLLCKQNSVWALAGLRSFEVSCALGVYPVVYTRVSQYLIWIKDHVKNPCFVTFTSNGTDPDAGFECPTVPPIMTTMTSAAAPRPTESPKPNPPKPPGKDDSLFDHGSVITAAHVSSVALSCASSILLILLIVK